jgi:hypothetical protein
VKFPVGMKSRQHRVAIPCRKGRFKLFENRNSYDPCWVFLVSDIIESKVLAVGFFEKNKIFILWYMLLADLNLMLMRLTFILGYFAI